MRVAAEVFRRQLDVAEELGTALLTLRLRHAWEVNLEGLRKDAENVRARVERVVGVLEDHLDLLPPREEVGVAEAADVRVLVENLARRQRGEFDDGLACSAFAGTGFTDETDRLAFGDGERDTIDGPLGFGALEEPVSATWVMDRKVTNLEEGRRGGTHDLESSSLRVVRRWRRCPRRGIQAISPLV